MKLFSIMMIMVLSLFVLGCTSSEPAAAPQEVRTAPAEPAPEPEAPAEEPAAEPEPAAEEPAAEPEEPAAEPEPEPVAEEPVAAAPTGMLIAAEADVASGSTFDFTHDGKKAILINFGGDYYAYYNKCPHSGGPSKLEDDVMRCQWHGRTTEPTTGAYIAGPTAGKPLQSIPVVVSDGNVYVDE